MACRGFPSQGPMEPVNCSLRAQRILSSTMSCKLALNSVLQGLIQSLKVGEGLVSSGSDPGAEITVIEAVKIFLLFYFLLTSFSVLYPICACYGSTRYGYTFVVISYGQMALCRSEAMLLAQPCI